MILAILLAFVRGYTVSHQNLLSSLVNMCTDIRHILTFPSYDVVSRNVLCCLGFLSEIKLPHLGAF